ncbi:glyoxylase-like metal-dependent hydrolase (beta-lactamase superfamily II) [Actinocorallia herbida]|uniref:Glyoxylase-like metal-dependent hydrolase (Beta-lactamase superfamily II) n=1 Tax=Actinocorallia herbida TaxID=58109 RepID=A0A3N1CP47_9ACTN|nr:MBL fold metallo-hydrolase [Actinocorallia herbida]ROO83099.1 glyoxylase-like metal-dependent hydrolase (beta-lactamase superfamily II) [Actinocorallia herbida]
MTARIESVVTSGPVTVDDETLTVEANTWIVGDDEAVIVIDPANDAEAVLKAVDGREVMAVVCTHGRDNVLSTVLEVSADEERGDAPIMLHRADRPLWRTYFRKLAQETEDEDLRSLEPDQFLEEGGAFEIADVQLEVLHTPGFTGGSITLYGEGESILFTGNTLWRGRPGAYGDDYPELHTQLNSISAQFGQLPRDTRVLTGQGAETTVGEEADRWESWYELSRNDTESDES